MIGLDYLFFLIAGLFFGYLFGRRKPVKLQFGKQIDGRVAKVLELREIEKDWTF